MALSDRKSLYLVFGRSGVMRDTLHLTRRLRNLLDMCARHLDVDEVSRVVSHDVFAHHT